MDVEEASRVINSVTSHNYGNFYGGSAQDLLLGVGLIYKNIRFPLINVDELVYDTGLGLVYILTHECDIAKDNIRPFNDHLIICPIIPLDTCTTHLVGALSEDQLRSFLLELGRDNISRVTYIPPIPNHLPFGGLVYLNQITHTHISMFDTADATKIESLTMNGLRIIDYKITNHLLRPKSESLSLLRY